MSAGLIPNFNGTLLWSAFQPLFQLDLAFTVNLERGCNVSLNHSEMFVEGFLKGLADLAQVTDPMVIDQNENKIGHLSANPKFPQQFVCRCSFLGERNGGIGIEELKFTGLAQEPIKLNQVLTDAFMLAQFKADPSKRSAVSFCNGCQSLTLSLAPGLLGPTLSGVFETEFCDS
jgi:hypothetical protein